MSGAAHRLLAMAESGDPTARRRLALVLEGAKRGDRGAQALKAQIDGIASGRGLAGQIGATPPTVSPYTVRGYEKSADPFAKSFYDTVVPEDRLDHLYQAGQTIGLVRQAEVGTPVPPTWRPLAGAQQNNRGRTIILPASTIASAIDANITDPSIAASVVETAKNNGEDAELILVTLGLDWNRPTSPVEPGAQPLDGFYTVVANLTWGVGGTVNTADIDWQNGLTFGLPASFVRVGATYRHIENLGTTAPDAILKATLAYGSHNGSSGAHARYTNYFGDPILSDAEVVDIPIPRFATSFSVCTVGITQPTLQLDVRCGTAVPATFTLATYTYSFISNGASQIETYPIPNGGEVLRITNLSGVAITNSHLAGCVMWNLKLS